MSLFNKLMGDFCDDPFFNGPMETVRRMESMFDSMMSPFGGMFGALPQLTDGGRHQPRARQNGNMLMPFGFGRSLFPNMDMFEHFAQNPSCHSYSSSSVMTFTTDESGQPHLYQASSSTRTGPGGVKETTRSVQDSRSGVQKMAIGHHMEDRSHVVERGRNRYTGEETENQEYVNMDEDDAESFNKEWQQRFQAYRSQPWQPAVSYNSSRWRDRSPPSHEREPLAITAGPSTDNEDGPHQSFKKSNLDGNFTVKGHVMEPKPKRKHGPSANLKSGHEKSKLHSRPRHETRM